jgi:murein DD-endopeptidase MepM/ murein hydrolase activator NlpD
MNTSKWMHLNRTHKKLGDVVYLGDHIADYGPTSSGFSSGPHLHLGVIKGYAGDFTMTEIERGEYLSDKEMLYRMWTNQLFGGPYRTTTQYLEAGYKPKYGQGIYEHWGLDGVKLEENDFKLYWPLHVPGVIHKINYNDMAGLYYIIRFNDDIKGHWAEKEIKLMVESGRMKGYPDGTFKPDRFITRAEHSVSEMNKK